MRNLVAVGAVDPRPVRVVVVGGGAAGVIAATHLLRASSPERPVDVRIIEREPTMGPGLAYRTTHPLHTLNNFAGRLSAVDGDPDHLLRWCAGQGLWVEPTSFLHRRTYGRYLTALLDSAEVPPGSMLRRNRGVVTDLCRDAGQLSVQLSGGWTTQADQVVLALGNPPPRALPEFEARGEEYLPDPWADDLVARVGAAEDVLLVGTGLTMVDVVAKLLAASPGTRFTAVSRHGLLPASHKRTSSRLHDVFHPGAATLDLLIDRVRARIGELEEVGGDWRDVIDSVRTTANELWRALPPEEQDRFVARIARHWEIARHRMSPDMGSFIDGLRSSGVLQIARTAEVDPAAYQRVINCTGPAPVTARGWNPLVDALLDRGTIRPHRLGLGLDLDAEGRLVDAEGRAAPDMYVVGAARRGVEWEVAAIPDLRSQSARLADVVVGRPEAHGTAARQATSA